MKVVLASVAIADLEAIAKWIARDNPSRAVTFVESLRERCEELGDFPLAYPLVPRFESAGVRRRPVGDFLIFYRVTKRIEVLHILHGARDYEPLLFPEQ